MIDLSIHDVENISVKATYLELKGENMKIVKIKINGWDNCINLHCKNGVEIDVSDALYFKSDS
tara:strand:- start:174 stop:362 length:189 start_codon:yes stop_codon:yes gene_type:complete